uniref:Acyl-CoA thioester hydrolase/bile acid-CoA amino acid N-acetyltransferase domain-containing protein n=1 Tax=Ciona savignyi TaxID=51511 RepID=H2Z824_CIOSA
MENRNARFNVSATDSMSDEPLVISITGLTCHQKHTLHSWIKSDNNNIFECVVIYKSNENGKINLLFEM